MAGPSRKIGPSTGWRSADGKAPPPQIGPRRRWQPGEDSGPRRSGRWVKILAVLGGLAVVAGGIGFLITLLIEPNPPRLVVVGADPAADAPRLDVPPDYSGWTTGQALIKWGKAEEKAASKSSLTAKVVANGDSPDSMPADPAALDDWVGKLAGNRFANDGRVLIYLGLHGGVDQTGRPFLWVGKGDRLPVADLFARLADKLAKRDVIVLLDPGRLPPDPLVGRLADSFADRLAKDEGVKDALAKHPRLVAICGVSPGEAAWESEELQATAFGQAVLRGLRGEGRSNTNAIYTGELFEFLKTATADWSGGNRPGRQTPFLLPAGDVGTERAGRMVAAYKSGTPALVPTAEPEIARDALKKLWQKHDELDRRPVPPAAYAPLAWRRGRELLVRYQQAVRAGERGAAGVLEPAVRAEFERVEASAPAVVDKSRSNSVPLAETFGDAPAAEADRELKKVTEADGLRNLDVDRLRGPGDGRPAESLLACMVDDFYRKQAGGTAAPAGWATALTVRRAAERAAFGGGPYGERAWPAVQAEVLKADARRREAEDRLFATPADEQAKATAALKDAEAGYKKAADLGQAVRDGCALRDKLFADLPFLGRWAAASGNADATQAAVEAWEKVHKLADALDAAGPTLPTATADARAAMEKARRLFDKARDKLNTPPESQDNWQEHEYLLASPLVPAELRMKAIDFSRGKTRDWLDGKASRAGTADVATRVAQAKEAARAHARLTTAALGPKLLDAGNAANDQLPRAARLEARLTELTEAKEDWTDKAAGIGHELLGHLKRADAEAAPKEYATAAQVDGAERASRSAVLLGENRTREPAEVAAALRWQTLLVGLADRSARDHWHDEAQEPYWQRAANRFLADARKARRPELPRVAGVEEVRADYPDARRLTVKAAAGTPDPLVWTSQRRREVGFQVGVPADFPTDAEGLAVGWRTVPEGVLRWDADADRRPMAVAPARGGTLAGTLTLWDGVSEDTATTVVPSARVYFRGQRPDGKLTVSVRRKPERVIKEPLPEQTGAAVAIRAEPTVPLGQVAILLDYSGSMRQHLVTGMLVDDRPDINPTKFRSMLTALREVLLRLPQNTPLQIRQFSAATRKRNKDETEPPAVPGDIFPEPGGLAKVTWDGPESQRFKDLMERLAGYYPYKWTPLVSSITDAVTNDFDRQTPALSGLPKTLVVLTDGVEEEKDDSYDAADKLRSAAARAARIRGRLGGLRSTLQRTFIDGDGRDVALYVVPFGQDTEDEKLSKELFSGIRDFVQPGRLWPPTKNNETEQLEEQLLAAIFPKLKLLEPGGVMAAGIDRTGLPSRPDRSRRPPYSKHNGGTDLRWSPWVPAGSYTAQPNLSRGTGPRLTLTEADTVVLGFSRDGAGGVRVQRELHADYFEQVPTITRRQNGGRWAVTSPWPVAVNQTLEATVFVERVPPHRLSPPDPREADLSADPPDPDLDGREVVWFDLLPTDPGLKPGKTTVTRQYGYAAPSWKVEREDWAAADQRVQVKVTVATPADAAGDRRFEPKRLTLRLPSQEPEVVTPVPGDTPADNLEVRTAIERQPPDARRPKPGDAEHSWLVVRVSHPAGKPVFARLMIDRGRRVEAVHRYYPAADGRADYTAAFRVPTADLGRLNEVPVNLAAVGWAIDESRRDKLAVTLDPATPNRDRQGEPIMITPGAPGDR